MGHSRSVAAFRIRSGLKASRPTLAPGAGLALGLIGLDLGLIGLDLGLIGLDLGRTQIATIAGRGLLRRLGST